MAQTSGPIAQGTTAERQFSDVLWRDLFGDERGVISDYDGSAYRLTMPSDTNDVVSIGSSTQASLAIVAGFVHKIPAGSPEGITIPDASGLDRTDIIALRYDPGYVSAPGPVRVHRIAGSSNAIPAYDSAPPGVEDLPLWAVTRSPGQNLNAATIVRMFPYISRNLDWPSGAALPPLAPMGTVVRQGPHSYRRVLGTSSVPVWSDLGGSVDRGYVANGVSDGSGYLTVSHTLGAVPTGIQLTPGKQQSDTLDRIVDVVWTGIATSTTFRVRARRMDNNTWLGSNPVRFSWEAWV